MRIDLPDDVAERLRETVTAVDGSCEPWTSEEVLRKVVVRGTMAYAQSAGWQWDDVQSLGRDVRSALEGQAAQAR
ncbi:MAG: hypothetical protein ACR2MA_02510 [Egibacteraceae bacterium]